MKAGYSAGINNIFWTITVMAFVCANLTGVALADVDVMTHRPAERFHKAAEIEGVEFDEDDVMILERTAQDGHVQTGYYISEPMLVEYEFNAFMTAWNSTHPEMSDNISVYIRLSRNGLRWTPWQEVFNEGNTYMPDKARYIQYKVVMMTEVPDQTPGFQSFSLLFGEIPEENIDILDTYHDFEFTQNVNVEKPAIESRADWGAAPPKGSYRRHEPRRIILHHSWRPTVSQYSGAATIRGIQRYHQVDNGWLDIGYHFLVGPDGLIFQGRPETAVGAHCPPNVNWVGICVIGDYDPGKDQFTSESREAVLRLMAWLSAEYRISTQEVFGHTDFSAKSCPGVSIYKEIPEFKRELYKILSGTL